MSLHRLNTDPSPKQLRVFALAWLAFFATAAGMLAWRDASKTTVVVTTIVAVVCPLAGWAFPPLLRRLFIASAYGTYPIGLVVSALLLGAIYALVITPIGLVARLFGYDPMTRKLDARARSYWRRRRRRDSLAGYFRQS